MSFSSSAMTLRNKLAGFAGEVSARPMPFVHQPLQALGKLKQPGLVVLLVHSSLHRHSKEVWQDQKLPSPIMAIKRVKLR
jgi:hypothetical protein